MKFVFGVMAGLVLGLIFLEETTECPVCPLGEPQAIVSIPPKPPPYSTHQKAYPRPYKKPRPPVDNPQKLEQNSNKCFFIFCILRNFFEATKPLEDDFDNFFEIIANDYS